MILDSRTLRSTPESGDRAGYDGHKRTKGAKLHAVVDTLGHLLAVSVTPAIEQDRAQVGALVKAVQEVTGEHRVCRGCVRGSGLDRGAPCHRGSRPWHPVGGGKAHWGQEGLCAPAPPLGGGTLLRLGHALPLPGQGLRGIA